MANAMEPRYRLSHFFNGIINTLHRNDFHAFDLVLGRIGFGDDGVSEAEFGGFFQALLPALYRAHFSGKTNQGVKISFYQAGSTVSCLATSLSVLCITGYPASGSMVEIFPFAPRASAKKMPPSPLV